MDPGSQKSLIIGGIASNVKMPFSVESADQVLSVKSLRMRIRKDKPEFLDVTFTVSSFEPL